MSKLSAHDKLTWLKNINDGMQTLVQQQTPGMIKARLVRLKKQIDLVIEEMENEEKASTTR